MENLLLSCIESRIENNRSFYGRFQLGPFDLGQGLTVATALRRTLLSELTGLAIIAVEIQGASHEYSALTGIRESVLDILLNLKQIVLSSEILLQEPQIGFLKVQGPGLVKASDIKLPHSINCVDPDQYIATLSHDGILEIKFIICHGKNYIIQTPLELLRPLSLQEFSKNPSEKVQFLTKFFRDKQKHFKKEIYSKENNLVKNKIFQLETPYLEASLLDKNKQNANLVAIPSDFSKSSKQATKNELSEIRENLGSKKNLENYSNQFSQNAGLFNSQQNVSESTTQKLHKKSSFWKPKSDISIKSNPTYFLETKKTTNILLLDTVFMPVNKVNFMLENDDEFQQTKERVILEIWTNGSIHPRQAIYEAATAIIQLFFPFQESRSLKSFFTSSPKTFQKNTYENKEKLKFLLKNQNLAIEKKRASIDIGNLDLSLRPYTCLKRANINTVNDLLQNSPDELLLLKNFGKRSLEEVEKTLAQINLKLRDQNFQSFGTNRKKN